MTEDSIERTLVVPDRVAMINLLGHEDEVLRTLERGLAPATIHVRGHEITLDGPAAAVDLADALIGELIDVVRGGEHLTMESVSRAIAIA
ncbi:MAG: PhoH family protein, partial [Ancrocorticia populi]